MRYRIQYLVQHAQETTNKWGNRVTSYDTETKIEETDGIKEARKRFSELRQTWETGNNEPLILKIKLQVQAFSITGPYWKDLLIGDYNEYRHVKDNTP